MGRNKDLNIFKNLDSPLFHGLFSGNIKNIIGNTVYIKDVFTHTELSIIFNISEELDKTSSNKQIWLNQCGEIGYGNESDLFHSFTHFVKNSWEAKKIVDTIEIAPKKYWKARKGECHLFNFLKALHCSNKFDPTTDYTKGVKEYQDLIINAQEETLKYLIKNSYGLNSSIGGVLYINDSFEQIICDRYVPAKDISFLRNIKGDFSQINDKNSPDLGEFIKYFNSGFKPKGYFHWGNIQEFLLPITQNKENDEL